ncbi:hypothetical protein PTE30175_01684 [Pandoraea terrae]|uniref:Uncharacterized protein n=1 Tax=Pandoraea terrae TaxID=1537710 RepID=A0A5E4U1Z1_9BURK|nr:hypothetical protein PTE30175_01684 [Pandoraea terrae]
MYLKTARAAGVAPRGKLARSAFRAAAVPAGVPEYAPVCPLFVRLSFPALARFLPSPRRHPASA